MVGIPPPPHAVFKALLGSLSVKNKITNKVIMLICLFSYFYNSPQMVLNQKNQTGHQHHPQGQLKKLIMVKLQITQGKTTADVLVVPSLKKYFFSCQQTSSYLF